MFVVSGFLQSARPERSGHVRQSNAVQQFCPAPGAWNGNAWRWTPEYSPG